MSHADKHARTHAHAHTQTAVSTTLRYIVYIMDGSIECTRNIEAICQLLAEFCDHYNGFVSTLLTTQPSVSG